MKSIVIYSVLFFLSCIPASDAERLYFKEIKNNDIYIEWFYYSLIGNTTPEYVIVSDLKNNISDTICQADYIKDVYLKQDTIFLIFNTIPKRYGEPITISKEVYNYKIQILKEYTEGVLPPKELYIKDK